MGNDKNYFTALCSALKTASPGEVQGDVVSRRCPYKNEAPKIEKSIKRDRSDASQIACKWNTVQEWKNPRSAQLRRSSFSRQIVNPNTQTAWAAKTKKGSSQYSRTPLCGFDFYASSAVKTESPQGSEILQDVLCRCKGETTNFVKT